ncbi:MAG: HEAT repeat domain-containing protein [Deltaproteobacteria bacterium]|nr:HEAT repeat domain-containing protein [Deltaproteobacteria bacterium]
MKYFLVFIFSLLSLIIFAEDVILSSLKDDRINTLRYGIDDEVVVVINAIKNEKDYSYNNELLDILLATSNSKIIVPILDFFAVQESELATDYTVSMLKKAVDDYIIDEKVLRASIAYSGTAINVDAAKYLYELSNYKNPAIASEAIRMLAKTGDNSFSDKFLERLQDDDFDDNETALRESSILLLGELKYKPSVLTLIDIVQDGSYSIVARRYACDSLGKIGDEQAIPILKELLNDSDSILRSYVITSLAYFETEEIESILIQSLRDSFWRIRVAACKALSDRKTVSAVDILIYKAEKDPEANVKKAAISAIAVIGGDKAWNYISDFITDKKQADVFRATSIAALLKEEPVKISDSLKVIFEDEWEKESSWILNYSCKELSTTESGSFQWFYDKMLSHPNYIIRIYAIRGIRLNNVESLFGKVKDIADNENENRQLRKEAASVNNL